MRNMAQSSQATRNLEMLYPANVWSVTGALRFVRRMPHLDTPVLQQEFECSSFHPETGDIQREWRDVPFK